MQDFQTQLVESRRVERNLKKARGRFRSRRGKRNLYHVIVDKELERTRAQLDDLERKITHGQLALQLLEDYDGIVEEVQRTYSISYTPTAGTGPW